MFYVLAVVWGLGLGVLVGNILALICLFCGKEQMALLFGVHLLSEGIGGVIGTPLSGLLNSCYSFNPGLNLNKL